MNDRNIKNVKARRAGGAGEAAAFYKYNVQAWNSMKRLKNIIPAEI